MTKEQFEKIYKALTGYALLQAKEVLNLEDCQLLTGLSRSHLYKLIWGNKIPYYKDPCGRKVHFKKSEIEGWLLSHRVPTSTEMAEAAEKYCATHKRQ